MKLLLTYILFLGLCVPTSAQGKNKIQKAMPNEFGFDHIITATPISGILAFNNVNAGVGLDYEYIISRKLGLGIHIPIVYGFDPNQDYSNYYDTYQTHTCYFIAPGLQFHTAQKGSKVDFVTGPSVILGNMSFVYHEGKNISGGPRPLPSDYNYPLYGIAVDNSLNFIRNNFQFGFNIKTGAMQERYEGTRFFIQFGLRIGGLF